MHNYVTLVMLEAPHHGTHLPFHYSNDNEHHKSKKHEIYILQEVSKMISMVSNTVTRFSLINLFLVFERPRSALLSLPDGCR